MKKKIFGAIELGGTKSLAMVANDSGVSIQNIRIATTDPGTTLRKLADFFHDVRESHGVCISALGIGAFGPIDLKPASRYFGFITTTPKPGWKNTNVLNYFREKLQIPVFIDTDVNAAALGEYNTLDPTAITDISYITIGTGIGAGFIVNGDLVHGAMHPEFGHILLRQDTDADPFPGVCPYHGNCFEGLASGPALEKRWGCDPALLPDDHPALDLEAVYIGQAVESLICTLSPQRIIIGGGVMSRQHLFPLIRGHIEKLLNGYIQNDAIQDLDNLIVPPALGSRSGILGALRLALNGLNGIT